MSTATLETVRALAEGLEQREQLRNGGSREEARARLARRIGIMPGTLYNLARDRLKGINADVRDRLMAHVIEDLQSQIARHTHDIQIARQLGAHPASPRMVEAQRLLGELEALLAERAS